MEFLHRLTVASFALHRIIDIIGTIQISNAAPTETYEMFSHEIRVVIVVHHHLGHIVQSVRYAVVEDNGHASGCQTAINNNVLLVAAKTDNQTVHHKLLHHLRSIRRMHLRHYHADGVGAAHLEVHRHWITAITETLRLAQHSLTGFAPYVLVVGKGTRHCGNRNAKRSGYIFYCYMFHCR